MSSAPPIDLSAIPESQRAAVLALLQENGALKDANRRLEHLVAELNHVVHGKRSEKLSEDDRQLAFEDLETAIVQFLPVADCYRGLSAPRSSATWADLLGTADT